MANYEPQFFSTEDKRNPYKVTAKPCEHGRWLLRITPGVQLDRYMLESDLGEDAEVFVRATSPEAALVSVAFEFEEPNYEAERLSEFGPKLLAQLGRLANEELFLEG